MLVFDARKSRGWRNLICMLTARPDASATHHTGFHIMHSRMRAYDRREREREREREGNIRFTLY